MIKENVRVLPCGSYVVFSDYNMTWPMPGGRLGELEWTLRYSNPSRADQLLAASVIAAYRELVLGNDMTRRLVARGIKQARDSLRPKTRRTDATDPASPGTADESTLGSDPGHLLG